MSFLTTTTNLSHSSTLPEGTTHSLALSMLSDYEFFLSCDPVLDSFKPLPPNPSPDLPSSITSQIRTDTHQQRGISYTVIDIVHTTIWDSKVVSTYEFTDITNGVFVRIKSPMGIVMDTVWQVREKQDKKGEWELVEDLEIRCNRLLVGVVKGQCEEGWGKIHGKMIKRLEEDINKADGK
ncbi:hypothetical protein QC764_108650 [Podospora pseudoanserina]|uniref:DUF7053 domain-containing protein n=1 Tax=Podospora pseudoanserina TaxID=2609844 RepID=A0ABR0IMI0_9PEZI|nr:hypothetical protein QC764_108650 [Podospora pseudoanserina]